MVKTSIPVTFKQSIRAAEKLPFLSGNGWISQFVNSLSPDMQKNLREFFLFKPNDTQNELWPMPRNKHSYPGVERSKGFRYPSPGSQGPVNIPQVVSDDSIFDTKYLSRDTRRYPREIISWTPGYKLPVESTFPDAEPGGKALGAPGTFGNPAVKKYDETGLRSAMTATNPELEKSLLAHMPIHNVHYEYDGIGNQIVEACDKKGIPIPPGRRTPIAVPKRARMARW